jgi:hypothetical protein
VAAESSIEWRGEAEVECAHRSKRHHVILQSEDESIGVKQLHRKKESKEK